MPMPVMETNTYSLCLCPEASDQKHEVLKEVEGHVSLGMSLEEGESAVLCKAGTRSPNRLSSACAAPKEQ